MQSSKQHPLTGEVHVDEFFIGQQEEQKRGRSKGEKRLVIVALEKVHGGVCRAYAPVIESASSENFIPFFNAYILKMVLWLRMNGQGTLHYKRSIPV
jgi:hypothetical protein